MKLKEIIIFGALLLGGFIAIFLPNTEPYEHVIGESELIYEIGKEGRYITTDEVAQAIIENDPSFILVDIRTPEEYAKYTIDGAINIPYNKVMDEGNVDYFNQDVYTTILFSNGSSLADQTWLRLRSFDYQGNKVLKGGLNEWYKTILNPQKPNDIELTSKQSDQYLFRKGASIYFTGAQVVGNAPKKSKSKGKAAPIIKRKKKEVSGGCG
jgi:rhodanese-related sulfurtransferase